MGKLIKNDASTLVPIGTQGSLTIAGTADSWDASDDPDCDFEFIQLQVKAADGAYISFDGSAATSSDFQVDDLFTAVWPRATFRKASFLDVSTDGTVVYQGFTA